MHPGEAGAVTEGRIVEPNVVRHVRQKEVMADLKERKAKAARTVLTSEPTGGGTTNGHGTMERVGKGRIAARGRGGPTARGGGGLVRRDPRAIHKRSGVEVLEMEQGDLADRRHLYPSPGSKSQPLVS